MDTAQMFKLKQAFLGEESETVPLRALLGVTEEQWVALISRATQSLAAGFPREALAMLATATFSDRNDPRVWRWLGESLRACGQHALAQAAFSISLQSSPHDLASRLARAEGYMNDGALALARLELMAVVALGEAAEPGLVNRARLLLERHA